MKLDNVDLSIIKELQRDSRLSMRELGRKIKLSAPSVTERVRQLESFGVIKRYTLDIDQKKDRAPRLLHCRSDGEKRKIRSIQNLHSIHSQH